MAETSMTRPLLMRDEPVKEWPPDLMETLRLCSLA